jgi:ribosome-associated translation inhibitor RaiA
MFIAGEFREGTAIVAQQDGQGFQAGIDDAVDLLSRLCEKCSRKIGDQPLEALARFKLDAQSVARSRIFSDLVWATLQT